MANKKISEYTALGAAPATNDIVPIVDVSDTTDAASGTTKKITITNLLTNTYQPGGNDVAIADGGTGASTATAAFDNLAPTTTQGDIIYHNGTDNVRLAKGTAKQVLQMNTGATAPEWSSSVLDVQTFTSSGTWTKPNFGTTAFIQVWGGGGSGGKTTADVTAGGGGGGAYVQRFIALSSLGGTETVTIGAGGAAKSTDGSGNVGGNSTFGSWVTAYGGGGGFGNGNGGGGGGGGAFSAGVTSAGTTGGNGGAPITPLGLGGSSGNPGVMNVDGGGGGGGAANTVGGASTNGGGGGGGANVSTGGKSINGGGGGGGADDGPGGVSLFGGNGGAGVASGAGVAGSVPAGGGGGSKTGNSGAGGDGKIIVTVF